MLWDLKALCTITNASFKQEDKEKDKERKKEKILFSTCMNPADASWAPTTEDKWNKWTNLTYL